MEINRRLWNQIDNASKRTEEQLIRDMRRYYMQAHENIVKEMGTFASKGHLNQEAMNQYNRLSNLEKEITKEIGKMTGQTTNTIKATLRQTYEESYYRTAFALEKTINAKLGFGVLNPKLIEEAVINPLDRITWLERNKDNNSRVARQLREILNTGLIQGKSYEDIAKDMRQRLGSALKTNGERIARTEIGRVRSTAKLRCMKEAESYGVEQQKMWIATLDDATRDRHQDLDGQAVDLDEKFCVGGDCAEAPRLFGVSELDINCRCDILTVIKGFGPKVRRARNSETGKSEIVSYRNYHEWKAGRIND